MTKNNNDFAVVLRAFIDSLGIPFKCRLDFLDEKEGLVLYPLPGGQVKKEYMDGSKDVSLNERDGQGYYIYLQDITASLTILNTKGN